MEQLNQLLTRYGKRPGSLYWFGERPDVTEGQLKRTILAKIGYPGSHVIFDDTRLIEVDWSSAARVLAFSGTKSLPYEFDQAPSTGEQKQALDALRELDGTAQFFSNGFLALSTTRTQQWNALSNSTFDTGVLGYDASSAFVFWIEEED